MTFIVRIARAEDAGLTGIVERVRTGEKHRFHGLEELAPLLARLLAAAGVDAVPDHLAGGTKP